MATLAALSMQQAATDTRAIYQVDPHLRVPSVIQVAAGVERQLPHGLSVAVNYTGSRGDHELLTRDINAPLPTVFNSEGEASGPRPFGNAAGDIYQFEGAGVFRQNQLITTANAKVNRKFTMFGYYVLSQARSDTDGFATMPANPYDISADYGRAGFDFRQRAFVSASTTLPFGIRMAPFIFFSPEYVVRKSPIYRHATYSQDNCVGESCRPKNGRVAYSHQERQEICAFGSLVWLADRMTHRCVPHGL